MFRHGWDLRLSECTSLPRTPKEPTRPGTPGMQIYGTAGTINKAREEHDLESATSPMDIGSGEASSAATSSNQPLPGAGPASASFQNSSTVPFEGPSGLDELQLAYNWSNGVYDWDPNHMGWADFDMRWSFDLGQPGWPANNDFGTGDLG